MRALEASCSQSVFDPTPIYAQAQFMDPAKLPSDLFLLIMNLTSPADQQTAFQVSKAWERAMGRPFEVKLKDIWQEDHTSYDQWIIPKISQGQSPRSTYIKITEWAENLVEISKFASRSHWKHEPPVFPVISKNQHVVRQAFEIMQQMHSEKAKEILTISNWSDHRPQLFHRIDKEIALFTNLEMLTIFKRVDYISLNLSELKNLQYVNLSGKDIPFPEHLLENWTQLKSIYLWNFSSVPVNELISLKDLRSLHLGDCHVKEIPEEVFSFNLDEESRKFLEENFKRIVRA